MKFSTFTRHFIQRKIPESCESSSFPSAESRSVRTKSPSSKKSSPESSLYLGTSDAHNTGLNKAAADPLQLLNTFEETGETSEQLKLKQDELLSRLHASWEKREEQRQYGFLEAVYAFEDQMIAHVLRLETQLLAIELKPLEAEIAVCGYLLAGFFI